MKNKILILASFPAPYRIDVFQKLCIEYDADVFFATSKDDDRAEEFFVSKEQLRYYLISNSQDMQYFNQCKSKLREYKFVLAYDWYLPFAIKVELQCILQGIPYYINCDGAFVPKERYIKDRLKYQIKRFFVQHAEGCLASGEYAKAYFKHYGAKEMQIYVHPFSSLHQWDIFDDLYNEKQTKRLMLGLEDRYTVLSIGQFIPRKGYDTLLRAWQEFDDECQLILIGGGRDVELYKKIISDCQYRHVKIFGFKPKYEIIDYYKVADVFVLPTREDIWGLVINEAMACGLPVISTVNCVAACELIDENKGGHLVASNDEKALAEALQDIRERKTNQEMGRYNLKKISKYTVESVVENHLHVFKQIR